MQKVLLCSIVVLMSSLAGAADNGAASFQKENDAAM